MGNSAGNWATNFGATPIRDPNLIGYFLIGSSPIGNFEDVWAMPCRLRHSIEPWPKRLGPLLSKIPVSFP
jgi:hypothetical protein